MAHSVDFGNGVGCDGRPKVPDYSGAKFKELVLYLSQRSADDEGFGMVKLNKLLYRADFEAFRTLGRSITGVQYEKQEFGPVARQLPLALDDLARQGYVIWRHFEAGPYTRKVPEAIETPDLSLFADEEVAVADRAVQELSDFGGKEVSEWSHDHSAGWRVARIGEEIPYATAIVSTDEIDDEAIAYFRRLIDAA